MSSTKVPFAGRSLRRQLILCFTVLAILPLLASALLSFHTNRQQIIRSRNQLANMDARQIAREFDNMLSGYEDILYQLYTDDSLAAMVENLNRGEDVAVTRNQIRRELRSVFWLQDDIASISVITRSGETAFYDRLSYAQQQNISFDALDLSNQELYDAVSGTRGTTYFPTQYVTYFGGQDHHLFYVGHSMISQQAISEVPAVIIMGINAELFQDALSNSMTAADQQQYLFVLDDQQRFIWYPQAEFIQKTVTDFAPDLIEFVRKYHEIESPELAVFHAESALTGWDMVYVLDCTPFTQAIDRQLGITIGIALLSFALVIGLVCWITNRITRSVQEICRVMNTVSSGDLTVRVAAEEPMATEIHTIARGLNTMADRLQILIRQEQDSLVKVKNAEIAALEAQLNPHFLYNTLDTINWMAIEREEYPISNVISALGRVLRYGIDNSNGIVTLAEEENWLKQYLFIHQNRMKSGFVCDIHIDPELRQCKVHKLLFQPFIENAMIHGFAQKKTNCHLEVSVSREGEKLRVDIRDNGCGIPADVVQRLDITQSKIETKKRYRGMQNAMNRLLLYYGAQTEFAIESSECSGTHVSIKVPILEGGQEDAHRDH